MDKLRFWTGFIEVLSFILLVCTIIFFVQAYTALPERIAFAFGGDTSSVENGRFYLMFIFWLGMLCYGLLFVLKRFPRLMSYPVKITPDNVDIQARLAKLMMSVMTLFCMAIIVLILYDLYMNAVNVPVPGSMIFIGCLFGGILADVAVYFYIAKRKK